MEDQGMLTITIPATEQYDEVNELFITSKEQVLQLEHSLVSISKWESKWCKAFLSKESKSVTESIDYIRCMTLTQNISPDAYKFITPENINEVSTYIETPMTATVFSNEKKTINREIITAEIIYYWMVSMTIPFECQKWHLNRLLTLINVCNLKNQPAKKMNRKEITERNRSLNAARLNALNTSG
jgi:hypothetical protein